jgi:hypothetical protein
LKIAMTLALLLGLAATAAAQDSLEQKRDKKLQSAFLKKAAWITDYDAALAESKKSGKPIFGYFTRSFSP